MNGNSIEDAIWVEAKDEPSGIKSEYETLERMLGIREKDWKLEKQELLSKGEKYYDAMHVITIEGERKVVYFDITGFFGKFDMNDLIMKLAELNFDIKP